MPPDDVQEAKSVTMVKDKKDRARSRLSIKNNKKSVSFSVDDIKFGNLKSWEKWVIINSRPKEEPEPVFEPVDTRWAPLGPMTHNDWEGWKKWVDKKCIPKPEPVPVELPPSEKVPLWKLKDRIEKLATSKWPPVPRPSPPLAPIKKKTKLKNKKHSD